MNAHLYAVWICIGVNKQWHKAAVSWLAQQHRRTRQALYPKHCSSALVYGDCKSVCSVDCIGVTKQWHKAAVSWLAQQHRRTRQAVNPKHSSSALVYGECTPVCSVDLHRCK